MAFKSGLCILNPVNLMLIVRIIYINFYIISLDKLARFSFRSIFIIAFIIS